jgi:hypothetical protein
MKKNTLVQAGAEEKIKVVEIAGGSNLENMILTCCDR